MDTYDERKFIISVAMPLNHQLIPPRFRNLQCLVDRLCERWPEHESFLARRFDILDEGALDHAERLAELVLRLTSDNGADIYDNYRWMCEMFLQEELHFRRTGSYRLSTFQQALDTVYNDSAFMSRYMSGLLLSQVLWLNHANVSRYYVENFLPGLNTSYRHLEIGPGHGLYLYFAACDPRSRTLSAWDVSDTSLTTTRHCLEQLGIYSEVQLINRSVLEPIHGEDDFDSIVISEVLEHLETPLQALENLRGILARRGRLFVNVPVNSPAPDHIYLWREPEEIIELIKQAGFTIAGHRFLPLTGYTEAQARQRQLTISVSVIATH